MLNIVTHCGAGGRQQIGQAESTLHPCGTEVLSVPVLQAVWEWPARLRQYGYFAAAPVSVSPSSGPLEP